MKFRNYLVSVLAFLFASAAVAETPATYNSQTGQLVLPLVSTGGVTYSNVVIQLNSFSVISVGGTVTQPPVTAACTNSNFSTATFNAIQLGMTLEQVKQTIGCTNDTSLTQRGSYGVSYAWSYTGPSSIKLIIVWFDAATGNVVTRVGGNNGETQAPFKSSSGF